LREEACPRGVSATRVLAKKGSAVQIGVGGVVTTAGSPDAQKTRKVRSLPIEIEEDPERGFKGRGPKGRRDLGAFWSGRLISGKEQKCNNSTPP